MNSFMYKRDRCPTCNSEQLSDLYKSSFTTPSIQTYLREAYGHHKSLEALLSQDNQYSLVQCCSCELIFQENILTDEIMFELYERWIDPETALVRQRSHEISYFSRHSQDVHQLLKYLRKKPYEIKVLDFGMGWGSWVGMAKAFGCEVYGVELSPRRIDYAHSNGITVINWDDIAAYKFDIINTDQVFEHIANPIAVLLHLSQSLKSDGIIKICVPNSFGIRYRLQKMDWNAPKGSLKSLNPVAPLEHINCFTRKSMLSLAATSHLSEVKLPLRLQYQHTNNWNSSKQIVKNLVMPIYRNVLGLQNYYLFKKANC